MCEMHIAASTAEVKVPFLCKGFGRSERFRPHSQLLASPNAPSPLAMTDLNATAHIKAP